MSRVNGEPVVQLRISARPNSDVVRAGREVKKELAKILETMPDFSAEIPYDDSLFVEASVTNVLRDMGFGILLTAVVLYLFLRRFSATIIVAIAMPVALFATFAHNPRVLPEHHELPGLAIPWVLVNNSILIIENIYRFRDMGCEPARAPRRHRGDRHLRHSRYGHEPGVFIPVAIMRVSRAIPRAVRHDHCLRDLLRPVGLPDADPLHGGPVQA